MKIDGITPDPTKNLSEESANRVAEEAKLKEACEGFETMLINQVFTEMRKSVPKSDIFGESDSNNDLMASMLDQERAKMWSKSGGIGLANILYQQVKDQA